MASFLFKNHFGWQLLGFLAAIFLAILIPTYWHYYGPQNFLWLSDIGLFLTCLGLWFNSSLLMSMAAVGVLALELFWCVAFFGALIFKINITTLADYMFNPAYPLALRAISLFHVVTPIIWLTYLYQFGYNRRALVYFTFLYWIVLALTCTVTNPVENINWVFMGKKFWVLLMAVGFPTIIFWPTDLIFKKCFKSY